MVDWWLLGLSDRQKGIAATIGIVVILVAIDYMFGQQAWVFSVTALIAWSIADFIHDMLDIRTSIDPVDFAFYGVAIIAASAAGALFIQRFMPTLLVSDQSPNASKLDVTTKLLYSGTAGIIAYVLSNFRTLRARMNPTPPFMYSTQ